MNKDISLTTSSPLKIKKILEVGKFYLLHDGSLTGHPALIIWKDEICNLFLAIKFGSSKTKQNFLISTPIDKQILNSYCYKRLFLGKRKDFGGIELTRLHIEKSNLQKLLNKFDFLNPVYSKNTNHRDKRYYRKGIKKSPFAGAIVRP